MDQASQRVLQGEEVSTDKVFLFHSWPKQLFSGQDLFGSKSSSDEF